MLETSALGLRQDLGLLLVLKGAMTNSTYVSRFSFILIPYRFKVRDRFSAYTTCMAVLSFIAKDVVAKGLDHDTFVLSIRKSLRSSIQSPCGVSCGMISCSDVTKRNEIGCQ
ncbi:hypothetical protein Bca101_049085 [Brassica carinata]